MSTTDQLYRGDFKGVSFFIRSGQTTGGPKVAVHEVVNSSKRDVENTGTFKNTYNVECFVAGNDFLDNKNNLIRVINEPGTGILNHPYFGKKNCTCTSFTTDESNNNIGIVDFSLTFLEESDDVSPQPDFSNVAIIAITSESLFDQLITDMSEFVKTNFSESFQDLVSISNDVSNVFTDAIKFISDITQEVLLFSSDLTKFADEIVELSSNPFDLAVRTSGLFTSFSEIFSSPSESLKAFVSLFPFSHNGLVINPYETSIPELNLIGSQNIINDVQSSFKIPGSDLNRVTQNKSERIINETVFTRLVRTAALAKAYQAMSEIEFNNVDELEGVHSQLEDQYNVIVNDNTLQPETLIQIQDLRNKVEIFFTEQRLTLSKIVDVDVRTTTAQVLSFQLYNDISNVRSLIALNDDADLSFWSGRLKAQTE